MLGWATGFARISAALRKIVIGVCGCAAGFLALEFPDAVLGQELALDRHRLSVADMMKVEGLGAAMIDPEGRWLIYERLRPYDQSDDYSFRTYAMGKTGHQLWR